MIDLDETDRTLLRLLAEDAGQAASALGRRLGLS
ncbi:MAG: AsnC family transcriptional regulator, partial [Planctomycetota bacterium]